MYQHVPAYNFVINVHKISINHAPEFMSIATTILALSGHFDNKAKDLGFKFWAD